MVPLTSTSFSAAVQDQVASVAGLIGGRNEGGGNDEQAKRTKQDPKKRIILLTAFLACLSCVVLVLNALFSFMYNVVKEDEFWDRLGQIVAKISVSDKLEKNNKPTL